MAGAAEAGRARQEARAGLRHDPCRRQSGKDRHPARRWRRFPSRASPTCARCRSSIPPLGGLNATPVEKLAKLFISPGPIYDPEGRGKDWWRTARGLFAGGFRAGDRVAQHLRLPLHARPARCSNRARPRSAAPWCRPASARPKCRWRRSATCAQRLRRHALVPQADRREGRRDEGRHLLPEEGAGRRRVPAARRSGEALQKRGIRVSQMLRAAPTSA